MTGETAALVTYALLTILLGSYSFSRISTLIALKRKMARKQISDSEE